MDIEAVCKHKIKSQTALHLMTTDEIEVIIEIIDKDKKYGHFVNRIQKDFRESQTKGIPVAMRAFFAEHHNIKVGFSIISISPLKMREWEKVFKEEGWTEKDFSIDISSFELMYLYVKPEYRRRGIGTQLFQKVLAYAKRVGIKKIYSYISDTTDASLQFYLHHNAIAIRDFSLQDEEETTAAFLMWEVESSSK